MVTVGHRQQMHLSEEITRLQNHTNNNNEQSEDKGEGAVEREKEEEAQAVRDLGGLSGTEFDTSYRRRRGIELETKANAKTTEEKNVSLCKGEETVVNKNQKGRN